MQVSTDYQEIEWQYDAPHGLGKIEEWLGGCDPGKFGLAVLRGSFEELKDTYYDTEDWRLYRAGYALRIRQKTPSKGAEATMKSLISAAGNPHKRREVSEPLTSEGGVDALQKATGLVGARLKVAVGPRKVRPIFEVRTRRQTFDLLLLDGQPADPEKLPVSGSAGIVRVGEVALDDSEIPRDEEVARLLRVEVEVDASAMSVPSELEGFVKAMQVSLGLRPAANSKYEVGLFVTGQDPGGEDSLQAKAKGEKKEQ